MKLVFIHIVTYFLPGYIYFSPDYLHESSTKYLFNRSVSGILVHL